MITLSVNLLKRQQKCFICVGQFKVLRSFEKIIVKSGSTRRLERKFEGNSSPPNLIIWSFTRRGSQNSEEIASKHRQQNLVINNYSSLPGFEIEKPACTTLVLKNVNGSYNGIYELQVQKAGWDIHAKFDFYIAGIF